MEKHKQQIEKNGKTKQKILKTEKKTADFQINNKKRKRERHERLNKKTQKTTETYLLPPLQTQAGTVTCNFLASPVCEALQ